MTFDEAVKTALQNPKYDALAGRNGVGNSLSLWDRLWGVIRDLLGKLFGKMGGLSVPENAGTGVKAVIVGVIAAAVIGLIALIAVSARHFIRRPRGKKKGLTLDELFDGLPDAPRTIPGLLRESGLCFYRGETRLAVRLRYIAMMLALVEGGALTAFETRTNREIERFLRSQGHPAHRHFAVATEVFNAAWFGNKVVEDQRFEGYKSSVAEAIAASGWKEDSYEEA